MAPTLAQQAALAALAVAAVAAQPELTSSNNELIARRQVSESASVFQLASTVSSLSSEVSSVQAHIQSGQVNDIIARIADTATSRAMDVSEVQGAMSTQIAALQSQIAGLATQQANTLAEITRQNTLAQAETSALVSTQMSMMSEQMTASNSSLETALTRTGEEISTVMAAVNQSLQGQLTVVQTSLAGKKDIGVHAWHGGCGGGQNGGWNWLCFDRNTLNTAAPFFRKSDNTRFQVTTPRGIFDLNFFTIGTSCNWQHAYFEISGSTWYGTHGHTHPWHWKDVHISTQFKATAGQILRLRTHANCGRVSAHGYSIHQKFDLTYVGSY